MASKKPLIESPPRFYSDKELQRLLGGIGTTTLWELRRKGWLVKVAIMPGSRIKLTAQAEVDLYFAHLEEKRLKTLDELSGNYTRERRELEAARA